MSCPYNFQSCRSAMPEGLVDEQAFVKQAAPRLTCKAGGRNAVGRGTRQTHQESKMITSDDIQRVRSQFGEDEEGYFWGGEFVSLFGNSVIESARRKDKIVGEIYRKYSYIMQDLWSLGIIIFKLEWMRSRAEIDESLKTIWWHFATVDIQQFFIEFRSIFDYTAQIIKQAANKPGQTPNSFQDLQKWIEEKPGHRDSLGDDLANLVDSVDWFPNIRNLRDNIIHFGGFTLPFMSPKEGILFQVYGDSLSPLVKDDAVMYNRNVVDFQLYSALYICRLFLFLENLASLVRSKLSMKGTSSSGKVYSPGFEFLINWLDRLGEKMKG